MSITQSTHKTAGVNVSVNKGINLISTAVKAMNCVNYHLRRWRWRCSVRPWTTTHRSGTHATSDGLTPAAHRPSSSRETAGIRSVHASGCRAVSALRWPVEWHGWASRTSASLGGSMRLSAKFLEGRSDNKLKTIYKLEFNLK